MFGCFKLIATLGLYTRIAFCSSITKQLHIPKCCPIDEHFNGSMACVKSSSIPEDWGWLINSSIALNEQITFSAFNPIVSGNTSLRCSSHSRSVLFSNMEEFRLLVTESGRLQLDVLVYSTQKGDKMVTYTDAFCLDAINKIAVFCPCTKIPCVRKCCYDGYVYNVSGRQCVDTGYDDIGFWRPNFQDGAAEEGYYVIANRKPTCESGTAIMVASSNSTQFAVDGNGNVKVSGYSQAVPWHEYCGEAGLILVCPGRLRTDNQKSFVYGVLLIIDGALLILSVVITGFLLPSKVASKFHYRVVTAHNAALAIANVVTGVARIMQLMRNAACICLAFIIQFTFIAAFLWLNVMCIDIAWAFSGLRPPQGSALERDHKKFILYSIYAWGTSGILSVITATVEFVPGLAVGSPLKPNFGHRACWFEESDATLAYFYGPMAFLLLANLILFLYTAARIISVRRDTAILSRAGSTSGSAIHKDRQRLVLYVKLFCLMGLTWITEIISWAVGGADYYWYVPDFVNMLRAVFIFVIFCCKRNVLKLLKARFASCLPNAKITDGKSGASLSGPSTSLRLTASIKKSTGRPSQGT